MMMSVAWQISLLENNSLARQTQIVSGNGESFLGRQTLVKAQSDVNTNPQSWW